MKGINGYTNRPITPDAAKGLQECLDLTEKEILAIEKIDEWEHATKGMWYVSFSGGKDSTVLAYIAAKYLSSYKTPPHALRLLFCDTGLEYPEIRRFSMSFPEELSKRFPRIEIEFQRRRPAKHFFDVMMEEGYPIISKEVSKRVVEARRGGKTALQSFNGERTKKDGSPSRFGNIPQWKFLLSAKFKISDRCCNHTKKEPAHTFERETRLFPMVALMADESMLRYTKWLQTGCNAFEGDRPMSKPMSPWLNQDVLHYLLQENIHICPVYGDVLAYDGISFYQSTLTDCPLKCTGCQRTGCMFCGFGAHLETGDDRRFVRLRMTHPKQWKFCIEGGEWDPADGLWKPSKTPGHVGLGMGRVLDYIGVAYK